MYSRFSLLDFPLFRGKPQLFLPTLANVYVVYEYTVYYSVYYVRPSQGSNSWKVQRKKKCTKKRSSDLCSKKAEYGGNSPLPVIADSQYYVLVLLYNARGDTQRPSQNRRILPLQAPSDRKRRRMHLKTLCSLILLAAVVNGQSYGNNYQRSSQR